MCAVVETHHVTALDFRRGFPYTLLLDVTRRTEEPITNDRLVSRSCVRLLLYLCIFCHDHDHHHISVAELGHMLTRSHLTYPEVSSRVCHNSFCQLGNSVSLPWIIYYEALYLHVVPCFTCIPVICPELVLFLIPL